MNFGIRAHDIAASDLKTLCRKLREHKIFNIQLALKKSLAEFNFDGKIFSPGLGNYIKKELGDIHVSVLGCYIDPAHPDLDRRKQQLEFFKQNIKFAKYIGADMIGTETGNVEQDRRSYETAFGELLASMQELVEYAEKLGVMIGIECVHSHIICSAITMKRLLDQLDSPNVSVIFDPANMINEENYLQQHYIFSQVFDLYADKIAAIHLKDFTINSGIMKYVLPGFGIIDYGFLLKLINQHKPYVAMLFEGIDANEMNKSINELEKAIQNKIL